jgi:hypothetical protein
MAAFRKKEEKMEEKAKGRQGGVWTCNGEPPTCSSAEPSPGAVGWRPSTTTRTGKQLDSMGERPRRPQHGVTVGNLFFAAFSFSHLPSHTAPAQPNLNKKNRRVGLGSCAPLPPQPAIYLPLVRVSGVWPVVADVHVLVPIP